jgi:hypothetical protein
VGEASAGSGSQTAGEGGRKVTDADRARRFYDHYHIPFRHQVCEECERVERLAVEFAAIRQEEAKVPESATPTGTYQCPKCGLDYPHIHELDGSVTRRWK